MALKMVLTGVAMIGCLAGCKKETPVAPAAGERGGVVTTFYPTTYFASRIAGDLVEVACPLPADEDPATWEPDERAMKQYQAASLVVINGASFEEWVARAPLPRSRVVDTTGGVQDQLLRYEHSVTHSHGMAGEHSHEGIDGHTWLDPVMAMAQADAIREAMVATFPEHADALRSNAQALASDLRGLDQSLNELAEAMNGVTVICTHPAYNYLGRRYGWNLVVVTIDPESEVGERELAALREAVESAGPKRVVLWEVPTSAANEQAIKEVIGAPSVWYSPCERAPESGDFLAVMRENISRLHASVSTD